MSVLIPCFNRARWVGETIESVAVQSMRDLELIVIDDGSTDDSKNVIEASLATLSFENAPQFISRPNRGFVPTLIEGLERATGKYFAYVDSDDVWLPEKLSRQVSALEESGEKVAACFSDCWVIDENGQRTDRLGRQYPYRGGDIYLDIVLSKFFPPAPTCVFDRERIVEVGGFNPDRLMGDRDLWMRFARRFEVVYLTEPLAEYRVHGSNRSRDLVEGRFESILESLEDAFARDPWLEEHRSRSVSGVRARFAGAFYQSLDLRRARSEAIAALRSDWGNRTAWRVLFGSLLGRTLVNLLRRLRARVRASQTG